MSGLKINHTKGIAMWQWMLLAVVLAFLAAYAYFGIVQFTTGHASPLPLPLARADASIDETPITDAQVNDYNVKSAEPKYIEIPSLQLMKSRVTRVSLNAQNILNMPAKLDDGGWYPKSDVPGLDGAVLIDGSAVGASRAGIFSKISLLRKGDQIMVTSGGDKLFAYEVQDVQTLSLTDINKSGMREALTPIDSTKQGLNLLASAGNWIPRDKVFDRRVLVRASLVE
jgi:hypothetical protein